MLVGCVNTFFSMEAVMATKPTLCKYLHASKQRVGLTLRCITFHSAGGEMVLSDAWQEFGTLNYNASDSGIHGFFS